MASVDEDDSSPPLHLASRFRSGLHGMVEMLHGLSDLRLDSERLAEAAEDADLREKRKVEVTEREWREEAKKAEEAFQVQLLEGDEQAARMSHEERRFRGDLGSLEIELDLLRAKAVETSVERGMIEKRMRKERQAMEEGKRKREAEWKMYKKDLSEVRLLAAIKDETVRDLEIAQEYVDWISEFSGQLWQTIEDGERCLERQNGKLDLLRLEFVRTRGEEKAAMEESEVRNEEEREEGERMEERLREVEEELERGRVDVGRTEEEIEELQKSNERLEEIVREMEGLESGKKMKRKDFSVQVNDEDF